MRIAIVGTAGRKEDGPKLSKELYFKMVNDAWSLLIDLQEEHIRDKPSGYEYNLDLVSGGAAWSDHCAISLYLMDQVADSLTLYFPCKWDQKDRVFFLDNEPKSYHSPSSTANYYHKLFSEKMGRSSLDGIQRAIDKGAVYHEIQGGFLARNLLVGKVDALLCYGFSPGDRPTTSGSSHCWNNSSARIKIYREIGEL